MDWLWLGAAFALGLAIGARLMYCALLSIPRLLLRVLVTPPKE